MAKPKVKLTISMAPALVEQVKAVVSRKRSKSVSAYLEHAVSAQLAAEANFDLLIAESLDESGGPASRAERQRARRLLRGAA